MQGVEHPGGESEEIPTWSGRPNGRAGFGVSTIVIRRLLQRADTVPDGLRFECEVEGIVGEVVPDLAYKVQISGHVLGDEPKLVRGVNLASERA